MSRIHEALKKAEQERVANELIPLAPVASDAVAAKPALAPPLASANTTVTLEDTPVVPAVAGGYLRFDDIRTRCARPQWHLDPNVNIFFNSELNNFGAEQFRTLRSRLYQLRGTQEIRRILVTSSLPAEGKTFVVNNLAHAIVRQPDRRVLIIDADIRCSRLHVPLGAPSAPGLTDYLRGEADEMAIIQHGLEANLCLIPGGNEVTNPSELLSNGRLRTLLERLTPVFDWVILDSPPCVPVADASLLADLCDGILLVVRSGVTPVDVAQRAGQELQGKNVIGVVLNAAEETGNNHSYYYGYGDKDKSSQR
jgi:capsular exopolysaccharide synthesis family protein